MECAICGGVLTAQRGERPGYYRDEVVTVQSEFMGCEDCGEQFFSPEQAKAHTRLVKNEVRRKRGLLPPEEIVEIRTKLKLSQEELEELLGTGHKVVVRWESGKVIQGIGHDDTLRMLQSKPDLIELLREIQRYRSDERRNYEQRRSTNLSSRMPRT